jgi:hypothetical protein
MSLDSLRESSADTKGRLRIKDRGSTRSGLSRAIISNKKQQKAIRPKPCNTIKIVLSACYPFANTWPFTKAKQKK